MNQHRDLQINDMVRLSEKSLNSFYSQDEYASFYVVGGMRKVDNVGIVKSLDMDSFLDYVSEIISFKDGNNAGLVKSFYNEERINDACIVEYFDMIHLEWKTCRHKVENLYLVKQGEN